MAPKQIRVKAWHVIFLAVLVATTIALAWWQWTRFQSGSGTFQNLGYALQWPFFGAFFVYAYRKFMEYENEKLAGEVSPAQTQPSEDTDKVITDIDQNFLPQRKTLSVEEFNDLNTPTRRRSEQSQ